MEQQTVNPQPMTDYQPPTETPTPSSIPPQPLVTSTPKPQKFLLLPILLIAVVLLVGGGYFVITTTKNKASKTADNNTSTSQTTSTTINKNYINEVAGFSFDYPTDINFADDFTNTTADPKIVVTIKDLNTYEDGTNGYTKEDALADQKGLEQSKLAVSTGWPVKGSEKLVTLSGVINGREFTTLSAYEVCDVTFHRDLIFYHNNKQIMITYTGNKNMISKASEYSTQDEQNCGKDIIWSNTGKEKLISNLQQGTGPTTIQKWYDSFNIIISSLKITNEVSNNPTSLPITGIVAGKKINIDVNGGIDGTISISPEWTTKTTTDPAEIGQNEVKNIIVENGKYTIIISSFGSGRAVCPFQNSDTKEIEPNKAIAFEDRSGFKYLRQIATNASNELTICSNGANGITPEEYGENEAFFGTIQYNVPNNPDEKILNQMDNMLASFKKI